MVKLFGMFEIDLPDYLDSMWVEFLILLLVWLMIGLIIVAVTRLLTRLVFSKTETDLDEKVSRLLTGPVVILVFFFGAIESLRVLDFIPGELVRHLMFTYKMLVAIIAVYLCYKIFRVVFVPVALDLTKRRKQQVDKSLFTLLESVGAVIILVLGFFWVLTVAGVNVTVFLAGLGVAGLVLAFAMQDTLSNYFSGLHLMLDKPFDIGDTIEMNGEFMTVLRIGMRSTRLYNIFDHEIEIVPNNLLANQMISNVTKPDTEYRVSVEVGVAYGSPIAKVKEILLEAVTSNEEVVIDEGDKRPRINFVDFGDSALMFRARFFVKDVLEQWRVQTAVREHIDRRFREEGITIPFPQRTLSILPPKEGEHILVQNVPAPAARAAGTD